MSYVKNVTAYYRQQLDAIPPPERIHAGIIGHGASGFPSPIGQEFSRGFTDYFAHGRNPGIFNLNTPKSLGEE